MDTFLIFLIIIGVVGFTTLAWAYRIHSRGNASLSWPVTEGRIVESSVQSTSEENENRIVTIRYYVNSVYAYSVQGRPYKSNRRSVFELTKEVNTIGEAQALADLRPVGTKLKVYYDPTRPDYAVLERGQPSRLAFYMALGGIATLAAVALAIYFRKLAP